jgi:hypothetical protein
VEAIRRSGTDITCQLFGEGRLLPSGLLLKSRWLWVPPVPWEGREQRGDIRCCRVILSLDLWDHLAFVMNSVYLETLGTWEFEQRRRGLPCRCLVAGRM